MKTSISKINTHEVKREFSQRKLTRNNKLGSGAGENVCTVQAECTSIGLTPVTRFVAQNFSFVKFNLILIRDLTSDACTR